MLTDSFGGRTSRLYCCYCLGMLLVLRRCKLQGQDVIIMKMLLSGKIEACKVAVKYGKRLSVLWVVSVPRAGAHSFKGGKCVRTHNELKTKENEIFVVFCPINFAIL